MEWNYKQKLVLENEETKGKQNLLVSAAAGSGKTAVMVERIRRLVVEKEVGVDQLLVVTFTDAAAQGMKTKIFNALNDALEKCTEKEKRSRLLQQLSLLSRANISTFSSFALEIVRTYYQLIGVDPGLKICDEDRANLLKQQALTDLFTDLFDSGDKDFLSLCDLYCGGGYTGNLKSMVLTLHKFLDTQVDPAKYCRDCLAGTNLPLIYNFALGETLRELKKARKKTEEICDALRDLGLPNTADKIFKDVNTLDDVIIPLENSDEGVQALGFEKLSEIKFCSFGGGTGERDLFTARCPQELKDIRALSLKSVKDKIIPNFKNFSFKLLQDELDYSRETLQKLFDLQQKFADYYSKLKIEAGVMDFTDIERNAVEILKNKQAAQEYQNKFQYIFVDEYQDSNNVQEELISLIASPDNVFMVGDIKQSIYRFRKAEPSIFLNKYNAYSSGSVPKSEAIDLNCNFRSKRSVLDYINFIFAASMSKESAEIDYDEKAALVRGYEKDSPQTINHIPQLHIINMEASKEDKADKAAQAAESSEAAAEGEEIQQLKAATAEAKLAAGLILKWKNKEISVNKNDGSEEIRKLDFGDMAIIMRAVKSKGEIFYSELAKQNIPCYLQRSQGYFDTVEIRMFIALLQLIENKEKDIPLLAVLRNPVFGFCADDLAEIRAFSNESVAKSGEKLRYISFRKAFERYAEHGDNTVLAAKCRDFGAKIENWRLMASITPIGEFIAKLLDQTGIANFYGSSLNGQQQLANLHALSDKAESYQSAYIGGLGGFISYVQSIADRQKAVKTDAGQASIVAEGSNCVRIMTIHASKGLEYPLVIYAGLGSSLHSGHSDESAITLHKDFGAWVNLKHPKTEISYTTRGSLATALKSRKEEDAEILRLMYVATTRAQDVLLLTGTVNSTESLNKLGNMDLTNPSSASSYLNIVVSALKGGPDEYKPIVHSVEEFKGGAAETGRVDIFAEIDHACGKLSAGEKEKLVKALDFDFGSYSAGTGKRKYSVSEIVASKGALDYDRRKYIRREDREYIEDLRTDALEPAEIGTAYHTVMEQIPFCAEGKTATEIHDFIKKLAEKRILTQEQSEAVDPAKIAAFFESDIAKRAMASPEVHKERAFVLKTNVNGSTALVQGVIDLCFKEKGNWVLVDYKTNRISKESSAADVARLKKHYQPQLELYKKALEDITGEKVSETQLYFFNSN